MGVQIVDEISSVTL